MTLHLSFPSSTLGKLKKARGALEPLLQLLEFSVCAACLCTVCMCVRYVCQAVLICMVLLARRASPNGQKTKERDRMATHTVQAWLLGTFHASVTMETQHWFSLEGDNKPHSGGASSFAPWQKGR